MHERKFDGSFYIFCKCRCTHAQGSLLIILYTEIIVIVIRSRIQFYIFIYRFKSINRITVFVQALISSVEFLYCKRLFFVRSSPSANGINSGRRITRLPAFHQHHPSPAVQSEHSHLFTPPICGRRLVCLRVKDTIKMQRP